MLAGSLAARFHARRLALGCVVLTVVAGAGVARADLSAPDVVASSFPLGARCAQALVRAQRRVGRDFTGDPSLRLTAAGAGAELHVSDMCGVAGDATLTLARDPRPDSAWLRLHRSDEPGNAHTHLTRRHAGWRAVIDVVVEGLAPGDFERAFRSAVDVCLAAR